ncbi:MAG: HAD-IA family hydrolase [Candidatus Pacearchaeota archaeon]|jgi:epoxide hydrolase-like predicted phosphatase
MIKKFKKVVDKHPSKHLFKSQTNTKEIKVIIFDVGGVLLKSRNKSIHEYMSKKLKVSLEDWFDSIEQYWDEMIKDESTTNYGLTQIARHYHIPKYKLEAMFTKGFKKIFRKDYRMFRLLKKLKKTYKIAILSDQLLMSYNAFKKYRFDERVDLAIWSHKEGVRKPNIEIYQLIVKRLKVPAESCLFIDNRDWNLIPAKKIGMKFILFQNFRQLFNQLKVLGVKI